MLHDKQRRQTPNRQGAKGCLECDDYFGRIEGEVRPCPEDGLCQKLKQGTAWRPHQVLHFLERSDGSV